MKRGSAISLRLTLNKWPSLMVVTLICPRVPFGSIELACLPIVQGEGDESDITAIDVHDDAPSTHSHSHSQGHCFGAAIQHIAGSSARSTPASPGGRATSQQQQHPNAHGSLNSSPRHRNGTHVLESDDDGDEGSESPPWSGQTLQCRLCACE